MSILLSANGSLGYAQVGLFIVQKSVQPAAGTQRPLFQFT